MRKTLHFAAVFSAAVSFLPASSYPNSDTALSSKTGFSWFANTPAPTTVRAIATTRAQLVINTSRTWVCSPAGFGKRSTCVSG
jgi:hypothetical protein